MSRPVVRVAQGMPESRIVGPARVEEIVTPWVAVCQTGTCRWTYTNSVQSDVREQARWHRDEHRSEA